MHNKVLSRDFYLREPLAVARDLLGKVLVSQIHGHRVTGVIRETEAYDGESDQACHAKAGKTPRNEIMYGVGGHAYIYFTYGMHWMMNCVVGAADYPAAVLIRAIEPIEGLKTIRAIRTPIAERYWCDGPAKLTKSLGITGEYNGTDLCEIIAGVWIEAGETIPDSHVKITPRIGIENTPEPWKSKPWRFVADRL